MGFRTEPFDLGPVIEDDAPHGRHILPWPARFDMLASVRQPGWVLDADMILPRDLVLSRQATRAVIVHPFLKSTASQWSGGYFKCPYRERGARGLIYEFYNCADTFIDCCPLL